jgi:hypothetical protein
VTPKAVRNVLIIVGIAAGVAFLPGGQSSAGLVGAVLGAGVMALIVLIIGRLYRENRVEVFSLGDRYRAVFYASLAIGVFAMAARARLFDSDAGTLAWVVMMAAAAGGLYTTFQRYRAERL